MGETLTPSFSDGFPEIGNTGGKPGMGSAQLIQSTHVRVKQIHVL